MIEFDFFAVRWLLKFGLLPTQLDEAFSIPRYETSTGRVFVGHRPVNLSKALKRMAETRAERMEIDDDEGVEAILNEEWQVEDIVGFEWESIGPMSSVAGLRVLDIGSARSYAVVFREEEPLIAIAALEPRDSQEAFSELFKSLLWRNGKLYKIELFGSLPSETHNHRPDLIPGEVIREAYWEWMEWAAAHDRASWVTLRDGMINQLMARNPMERALLALGSIPKMEKARAYFEARDVEQGELAEPDRRLILENYMQASYTEATHTDLDTVISKAQFTPVIKTDEPGVWLFSDPIHTAIPLDDGRIIVAGPSRAGIYHLHAEHCVWHFGSPSQSAALSGDRKILGLARARRIHLWEVETQRPLCALSGHERAIECLAFSLQGSLLASASKEGAVLVRDSINGHELLRAKIRGHSVHSIGFSPDGRWLATAHGAGGIYLWDLGTGKRRRRIETDFLATTLAWHPNSRHLAVCTYTDSVSLHEVPGGETTSKYKVNRTGVIVTHVAFSIDGHLIALAHGRSISVWETDSARLMHRFGAAEEKQVLGLSFSSNSGLLIVTRSEGRLSLYTMPEA